MLPLVFIYRTYLIEGFLAKPKRVDALDGVPGFAIRIQEGKNDPQKIYIKLIIVFFEAFRMFSLDG